MDPLWYPDSGASHHITNDESNFSVKTDYTGNDRVKIGNGSGLIIKHIGNSKFYDSESHNHFVMNQLLHVPSITKNLLSVSQFCRDNQVFFEFHANSCNVKQEHTKETLLQGKFSKGLYVFPNLQHQNHISAFHSTTNSSFTVLELWHSRLAHASLKAVRSVLSSCSIPCNHSATSLLCQSCCMGKARQLPFFTSQSVYASPLDLILQIFGVQPP